LQRLFVSCGTLTGLLQRDLVGNAPSSPCAWGIGQGHRDESQTLLRIFPIYTAAAQFRAGDGAFSRR